MVNTLYLPELREMLTENNAAELQEFCTALHPARTAEFMEGLSAEEAVTFGLVDEVVESPEALEPRVTEFCQSFRKASPMAVALAKTAFRHGDDLTCFADCFETEFSREGIAAFLGKRSAAWME